MIIAVIAESTMPSAGALTARHSLFTAFKYAEIDFRQGLAIHSEPVQVGKNEAG